MACRDKLCHAAISYAMLSRTSRYIDKPGLAEKGASDPRVSPGLWLRSLNQGRDQSEMAKMALQRTDQQRDGSDSKLYTDREHCKPDPTQQMVSDKARSMRLTRCGGEGRQRMACNAPAQNGLAATTVMGCWKCLKARITHLCQVVDG